MKFVLDASTTLPWAFLNQTVSFDRKLLTFLTDNRALVPQIWPLEILNCLHVAVRRGDLDSSEPKIFTDLLRRLPIQIQPPLSKGGFEALSPLIERYQLSSYDACYVELAERLAIPIASHDKNVKQAASHLGVHVLKESDVIL